MTKSSARVIVPWLIRALPAVGLVVGAAAEGWLGAAIGLLVGFVLAVAASFALAMRAPSLLRAGRRDAEDVVKARVTSRPELPRQEVTPVHECSDAGRSEASSGEAPEPVALTSDEGVLVRALTRASKARAGVVHGRFVLEGGELRERTPREDARLFIETLADHQSGATLDLTRVHEGRLRAAWWRGENADQGQTIPAGFSWEKNDDYYYGTVTWQELHDVRFRVRPIRTWPAGGEVREIRL